MAGEVLWNYGTLINILSTTRTSLEGFVLDTLKAAF